MKRKGVDAVPRTGKRQLTAVQEITEADSIYDQVAPYLLVTARFPIDALTSEWSIGVNRPIDQAHKRRLRQIFDEAGVLRRDTSHRLQVACSKAQVQQMLHHLEEGSQAPTTVTATEGAEEGDSMWPSFESWASVVRAKAELIAGHHRVEAFKEYLQLRQLPEEERWWVCSIYDKDILPAHLRIQLRANREDVILPDSHGQIWTELSTLSSNNGQLFQGSNKSVEQEMLEHLRLSSRVKFPVRRLATLWRNLSWRLMITRWCRTLIGQATFNISTFEWMASCRIDDYWFSALDKVMEITSEIQGQHGLDVRLADWNKLAGLPQVRSVHDVQRLFYPSLETDMEPQPLATRQRDFFPNTSDKAYLNLYQSVLSEPARQFINIQALLKTTKQEGKLMSIVMSHVGQWVNKEPEKVLDRDNNKPALRKDLVPALREKYGDKADEKSQVLQQGVLNYVRENAKDFTSTLLEHYLHEYPSRDDDDAYGARFTHEVWRNVLSIVTSFAGPTLQHKYFAGLMPEETWKISPPTIAQTARDLICQIPEVASDPALRSTTAAEQLLKMMQPVIAQWISKQRRDVPDRHSEDGQRSTVHPADEQCAESEPSSRALCSHASAQGQTSAAAWQRAFLPCASEGSDTHESTEELTIVQSPKRGPTVTSGAGAVPQIEEQHRELIDFTLTGLNNLRKQHRRESANRQQRAQVQRASLAPDSHQPGESLISLSSRATTGSGHWRQSRSARRGK